MIARHDSPAPDENIVETACCAEFTGPHKITYAIGTRLCCIEEIVLTHEQYYRRGYTDKTRLISWVPGIFKLEANLYQYPVAIKTNRTLISAPDENGDGCIWCQNGNGAIWCLMRGCMPDILNLCNDICNLTGMTCEITDNQNIMDSQDLDEETWKNRTIFASIEPDAGTTPVENIESLLFDIPDSEEFDEFLKNRDKQPPKWTVGIVEEKLLGKKN